MEASPVQSASQARVAIHEALVGLAKPLLLHSSCETPAAGSDENASADNVTIEENEYSTFEWFSRYPELIFRMLACQNTHNWRNKLSIC